jgi:glycerate-2-kinase
VSGTPSAPRALLEQAFAEALHAVDPAAAVARALDREKSLPQPACCVALAAGKAALAMAQAWHARAGAPRAALAVSREAGEAPPSWQALVGGHPLPTEASVRAGQSAHALVAATTARDTLVVLLSGGASALLAAPLDGLTLADLRATTELLLRAGAEIGELNCVRKHLTLASGGRLARAASAHDTLVLALSDVLGDDPATIGSGPCAPDPTTHADAARVLRERGVWEATPAAVRAQLERGARGELPETPKPGDICFARVRHEIVANNAAALAVVEEFARARGLAAQRRAAPLRGEARVQGAALAREALALRGSSPALLVAGGETTVTVRGPGRGGRCQELALGAALALDGEPGVALLAASTDGSDGPTDAAGAFADGRTIVRGRQAGVDAVACLERNDAYAFFGAEGGLWRTGATGTNALDVVLVLVEPRS